MNVLRVGEIPYANVWPLYEILREREDCSHYEFCRGAPTSLNLLLREGSLDVSPSSSVEYLFNRDRYSYLPDLSVSSRGPVRSILLLSKVPIHKLNGRSVALTDQSATSVMLIRVLLEDFRGLSPSYTVVSDPPPSALCRHDAYLAIGDDALLAGLRPGPWTAYDLGELWWRDTGLPFVYALWIVRNETLEDPRRRLLLEQLTVGLQRAKGESRSRFEELSARAPQNAWYPRNRLVQYWRLMSYDLDEEHLRGMILFLERSSALSPREDTGQANLFDNTLPESID